MRQGARAVLKWFSLLYVVLIVIQVYLAGEGIFGLNVIHHSDDLICALIAWHPNMRIRVVSIIVPILTFVQMMLPGGGRWVGALHPVNAILILGMYLWLFLTLRKETAPEAVTEPVAAEPSG